MEFWKKLLQNGAERGDMCKGGCVWLRRHKPRCAQHLWSDLLYNGEIEFVAWCVSPCWVSVGPKFWQTLFKSIESEWSQGLFPVCDPIFDEQRQVNGKSIAKFLQLWVERAEREDVRRSKDPLVDVIRQIHCPEWLKSLEELPC